MSVVFLWDIHQPVDQKRRFAHGTSSDDTVLKKVFPKGVVTTKDIPTLEAMHLVADVQYNLWQEIAHKLASLQNETEQESVEIIVWAEY